MRPPRVSFSLTGSVPFMLSFLQATRFYADVDT